MLLQCSWSLIFLFSHLGIRDSIFKKQITIFSKYSYISPNEMNIMKDAANFPIGRCFMYIRSYSIHPGSFMWLGWIWPNIRQKPIFAYQSSCLRALWNTRQTMLASDTGYRYRGYDEHCMNFNLQLTYSTDDLSPVKYQVISVAIPVTNLYVFVGFDAVTVDNRAAA